MSVALRMDYGASLSPSAETETETETRTETQTEWSWIDVCALDDIPLNCGAPALIAGRQVALVRVGGAGDGDEQVYGLSNYDPFSEAFVIARGIVGDRGGCPKIASPIYKQSFDLRSGVCFDDPTVTLPTYPVRVRAGRVEVGVELEGAAAGAESTRASR